MLATLHFLSAPATQHSRYCSSSIRGGVGTSSSVDVVSMDRKRLRLVQDFSRVSHSEQSTSLTRATKTKVQKLVGHQHGAHNANANLDCLPLSSSTEAAWILLNRLVWKSSTPTRSDLDVFAAIVPCRHLSAGHHLLRNSASTEFLHRLGEMERLRRVPSHLRSRLHGGVQRG